MILITATIKCENTYCDSGPEEGIPHIISVTAAENAVEKVIALAKLHGWLFAETGRHYCKGCSS